MRPIRRFRVLAILCYAAIFSANPTIGIDENSQDRRNSFQGPFLPHPFNIPPSFKDPIAHELEEIFNQRPQENCFNPANSYDVFKATQAMVGANPPVHAPIEGVPVPPPPPPPPPPPQGAGATPGPLANTRSKSSSEEEQPMTHPRSYLKRLSAGDRGVMDDQNRHLPPMKDEEVEGWFRANEQYWTHPATIVYRLRDGRKVAMFTKKPPEKGRRRKKMKATMVEIAH